MKRLPIGIQTFEKLIRENYVYVDKTPFVSQIGQGGYYFLSRPRRFGKSLFLSTLKAAFEAKKELFQGFYLYEHWDWSRANPIIQISFGSGVMRSVQDLKIRFGSILDDLIESYELETSKHDLREMFLQSIKLLCEKTGQKVIILIDEYDKPILDNIDNPELALDIREELKNYYSVIKDSDPYIHLVFVTGVSKFSKVSLFSGLNNLKDITIDERYSTLCGYSQKELEEFFSDYLPGVDLEQVQKWYNGYSWLGEKVYNPFDILLYLDSKQFSNYWFESGTPTFLIKLLQSRKYPVPKLNNLKVGEHLLGSFDIDLIEAENLLFQTGYLTIKNLEIMGGMRRYTLGYPNQEVRQSLADSILYYFAKTPVEQGDNAFALYECLQDNDLQRLHSIFHAFFASIPYEWYKKNQAAGYEAYYASIVYCYFAATGMDVRPEVYSNKGRLDLVVRFAERVYLIEFKVMEQCGKEKALQQIKSKGYAEQFAGYEVYLIGVQFSSEKRNIESFEWERG